MKKTILALTMIYMFVQGGIAANLGRIQIIGPAMLYKIYVDHKRYEPPQNPVMGQFIMVKPGTHQVIIRSIDGKKTYRESITVKENGITDLMLPR